ncbi:MAG TPA: right-handed parallel beta-helix repeat-containing protein [Candidatus Angelobacter sp.]|jgi:hypothetical protein
MKLPAFGPKLLAGVFLILSVSLTFAQTENTATIDCSGVTPGAFTSIATAILSSPDHTAFTISGNCTENLVLLQRRNDLSFFASAPTTIQSATPTQQVMDINGSQNISFLGPITMSGGQGVSIINSSGIFFSGVTVQNSGNFGIDSNNSQVQFAGGSISANTRTGIVTFGGTLELDGVTVSNNGRLGISAATTHLIVFDGGDLPTVMSHNGAAGIQLVNLSEGDFDGNHQITNNAGGAFGLLVSGNSTMVMQGGVINGNSGIGVVCQATTACEFGGTQINGNTGGGIQIMTHSELDLDSSVVVSGNTGVGVLIDQASTMGTNGGNTITNNTGDALIVNALSVLNLVAPDTITATAGNLALNCNNGSMVTGDIGTFKPKKCGAQFQANPIH